MKKRFSAVLLLFIATALALSGCAKPDELKGTWVLKAVSGKSETSQKFESGEFRQTYTFDGRGSITICDYSDGEEKTHTHKYTVESDEYAGKKLIIDGVLTYYYSIDENGLMMQLPSVGFFLYEPDDGR